MDDRGRQVEGEVGIGPFREGESLSLECNVPGGKSCTPNYCLGKLYVPQWPLRFAPPHTVADARI